MKPRTYLIAKALFPMAVSVEIKILGRLDTPLIRALMDLFAQAFEDRETYLGNRPSEAYLESLLERPHFIACTASIDDVVVGGLVAYQLDKFEQDRREIYIYDLAVDAEFRRQGIATALIESLRDEATRRDAYVIFVQADFDDEPAISLYRKLGKQERVHHFDILPRRQN